MGLLAASTQAHLHSHPSIRRSMSLFDRFKRIVKAQVMPHRRLDLDEPEVEERAEREATAPPREATGLPADVLRAYRVLELEPGADLAAVKKAYRRQQQRYHQDRYADDPEKEQKARRVSTELNLAYERLQRHLRGERGA